MPFNPTLPVANSPIVSAELRDQFNGLKDLIDNIPPPDVVSSSGGVFASSIEVTPASIVFKIGGDTKMTLTGFGLQMTAPVGMSNNVVALVGNPVNDGCAVSQNFMNGAITTALTGLGASLPTADPHVVGALWNDAGVVKVSAG